MTLHFTTQQRAFQGRNDDGTEATATAIAAANTNFSQQVDTNFRIRFDLQETGGATGTFVPQLQYQLNAGTFTNVTTSSTVVRAVTSPNVTDGTATVNRITGDTGTFAAGTVSADGLAANVTVAASGNTEVEYVVQLRSADLVSSDTVQLRVVGKATAGTVLDTYPATPATITPSGLPVVASAESATITVAAADAVASDAPVTSGLRLWLAARKETGLTGGAGVQTPTNWSGLGNTLTQATGTAQPTYQTGVIDSQPVFRFAVAAAQEWIATSGDILSTSNAASGMTVFAVVKVAAFAGITQEFINFDTNSTGTARMKWGYRFVSGNPDDWYAVGRRLDADTQTTSDSGTAVDTNWHLHTLTPDWANGQVSFYREQTLDSTVGWTSTGTVSATNSFKVAVGSKGGSEYLGGDIAEILVYDRVLNSTERQTVWTYLLGKYPSLGGGATAAPAESATITTTAADATVGVVANADSASVGFVAADATVPALAATVEIGAIRWVAAAGTTTTAGAATVPVTAADASVAVGVDAGTATIPVAAADAVASVGAAAGTSTVPVAAADATAAVAVDAGAASLPVVAADATPAVAVNAGSATVSFVAADASAQTSGATVANAESATLSITAADAVAGLTVDAQTAAPINLLASQGAGSAVTVDAEAAAVPFAAADASVSTTGSTTASAQSATVGITAADASVASVVNADAAVVPVTAADAVGVVGALAASASVPVAAADAATALVVNADAASFNVTAADATVSTVTQTTADAQTATVPVAAADASVAVVVSAGSATMGMAAADATAPGPVDAQPATVPVAAADASVAVVALAGAATVAIAAADATFARFTDVSAQAAAITVTAADATTALGVQAGAATVPVTAADATVFIPPPVPPPRWVEHDSDAAGLVEGDSDSSGIVEGVLVGAGIVEGSSSL